MDVIALSQYEPGNGSGSEINRAAREIIKTDQDEINLLLSTCGAWSIPVESKGGSVMDHFFVYSCRDTDLWRNCCSSVYRGYSV